MIQDNLENEIRSRFHQTGKAVSLIAMHPKTWEDLCKEVWATQKMAIDRHDGSFKYRGITVLRSLDMVDGLFLVK